MSRRTATVLMSQSNKSTCSVAPHIVSWVLSGCMVLIRQAFIYWVYPVFAPHVVPQVLLLCRAWCCRCSLHTIHGARGAVVMPHVVSQGLLSDCMVTWSQWPCCMWCHGHYCCGMWCCHRGPGRCATCCYGHSHHHMCSVVVMIIMPYGAASVWWVDWKSGS